MKLRRLPNLLSHAQRHSPLWPRREGNPWQTRGIPGVHVFKRDACIRVSRTAGSKRRVDQSWLPGSLESGNDAAVQQIYSKHQRRATIRHCRLQQAFACGDSWIMNKNRASPSVREFRSQTQ